MHELSIAQSIVDIVGQYVPRTQFATVKLVRVRVGDLAGVVPDSLSFCFTAVTAGTPMAGALLEIEHVPYTIRCNGCTTESTTEPGLALCPQCGSTDTRIIAGTELQVMTIDVDDQTPEHP
jgi:hydrogenase nickel incorporation protein HypA/HybF